MKLGSRLSSVSHAWRALRHRNFRLYFAGQGISVIGTWMTRLATSWLVYRMTHSALLLGVVSFAGQIVTFLLGPIAGVWVERLERRKMLIWTQAAAAVQSLAMAALTLTHVITLWEIVALAAFQGVINAFDMPGRQSFLVQMVEDPEDLSNAIAISATLANGGRLIGPAIAGAVVAAFGEGWCFFIDGLSYFAVVASLLMMRVVQAESKRHRSTMWEQVREGWEYVSSFQPIRTVLILFMVTSLMGFSYMVVMPIFAAQILHGGANTLGWLTGASGTGALVSAISLAFRRSTERFTRIIQSGAFVVGVGLVLFSLSHTFWISMVMMLFVGFGFMQGASTTNMLLQSIVPEGKRARVMSYYTMAFFGSSPIGSLLAGGLAHWLGAPYTVVIAGSICLAGGAWFTLKLPGVNAQIREEQQRAALQKAA